MQLSHGFNQFNDKQWLPIAQVVSLIVDLLKRVAIQLIIKELKLQH